MTAPRPEPDAGQNGPYTQGAYEADGTFEAAVEQLADPLNDPLPGQHASPWFRTGNGDQSARQGQRDPLEGAQRAPGQPQRPQQPLREWYDPEGYERDWYGQQAAQQRSAPVAGDADAPTRVHAAVPVNDETVGLRTADTRPPVVPVPDAPRTVRPGPAPEPGPAAGPEADGQDSAPVHPPAGPLPSGGRAERRRAAKGRRKRRVEPRRGVEPGASEPAVPMSRLEARRAARAAKDSPAVVASRVIGEVFISLGVLMLLFVTYQLWWTNIRADQIAGRETNKIQDDWAHGERKPGVFEPGKGFAIMHIPKLDVVAPIAEGISKDKVLDRGMVGHYGEGKLKTAMPSAKQGNFAVAGHRNTHGEPFRYINKLQPGDPIVVETQDAYYTYEMTSVLPQTSPSNVSVIGAVPPGSGFDGPGRYITLTTCTPEFTSTYRLIVWGKMVDERPRSEGKPDALVG